MKRTVLFLTLLSAAVGLSAQQPKPLQITSETKFVSLPDHEWVSPLVDGVWTVKANYAYAFFLDDGRKLFDFDWAVSGNRDPQMLEGAVIMFKKGETFGKPQYILYRNGAVKELPASWTGAATNFVDGVALIGRKPQKGGMEYIYINTSGEQVYGKLTSEPDFFDGQNWTVPPLSEGLRAYKDPVSQNFTKKWGFIDANGKIVIPARFDQVRSFSGGYALVKEGNSIYFIDHKGNKAFNPVWEEYTDMDHIGDVRNGYFLLDKWPKRPYYNVKGEQVLEGGDATWFCQGYSFYTDPDNSNITRVIDSTLKVVDRIPHVESYWNGNICSPVFAPVVNVATVKRERVIGPDGTTLIQHYPVNKETPNNHSIGLFSRSGYAQAELRSNGTTYTGFINLDGQFVIIYDWDHSLTSFVPDPNNPLVPIKDPQPEPSPLPFPITPQPGQPIGPIKTTHQTYTVTVSADGNGKVSGGGKYKLGQKVNLTATPDKDWEFDKWTCETPGYYGNPSNGIIIDGRDLSFTAHFREIPKEDTILPIANSNAYSAHQRMNTEKDGSGAWVDFDVYLELSADKNIESPYGKNTYGFLTCLIDPTKDVVTEQHYNGNKGTASYKLCFVPMLVSGLINEGGHRYLVLDGGQLLLSDLQFKGADALTALFLLFVTESEGGTFGTVSNGRYRLELTDFDESTGECTFGELYRFHPQMGWVRSDQYPVKRTSGMFYTKTEKTTLNGDLFRGLKMKVSTKRKVDFVPPQGWVKTGYKEAVDDILHQMSTLVTDWEEFFHKK